ADVEHQSEAAARDPLDQRRGFVVVDQEIVAVARADRLDAEADAERRGFLAERAEEVGRALERVAGLEAAAQAVAPGAEHELRRAELDGDAQVGPQVRRGPFPYRRLAEDVEPVGAVQ